MPRGSKPGERRGGRQKGTPNRKTLLRNAALSAAAADPNLSPRDFLLNVMREQSFPLETRVVAAREALPYFHSKPQESVARQAAPDRYGNASLQGNTDRTNQQSINVRIFRGGVILSSKRETGAVRVEVSDPATNELSWTASTGGIMPLEFLLAAMRDPDTPANLRLRVASLVARYVHPRRSTDGPPTIEVDDPTGFSVDVALATELRDAERRYHFVCITRMSQPEHYEREAEQLRRRIGEINRQLECPCPSKYGKDQLKRDQERLKELERVRHSGLKLSKHEDIEEAWLTARVASWERIVDLNARGRLHALDMRRWHDPWKNGPPLTLREQAEFRALQTLYADHEMDTSLPGAPNFRRMKEKMMELTFSKYLPVEDMKNPGLGHAPEPAMRSRLTIPTA
jgi:hypothetical protein